MQSVPPATPDARSRLLQHIEDRLASVVSGEALDFPIINVHGAPGIGKTSMLRRIREQSSHSLAIVEWDASVGDTTNLQSISHPLRRLLAALRPYRHANNHEPLLVLLDSLNDIAFWKEVQAQAINPLLRRGNVLIICFSRAPLFWHFWEIRDKCEVIQLYAFSLAETEQFLRAYDRELLAHTAYHLTLGYPWALVQLLRRLDDDFDNSEPQHDEPFDLDQLSPSAAAITAEIGLLRLVDVPLMERLLHHFLPHTTNPPTRSELYATLSELRSNDMFIPYRRDRRAYRLRRILRHTVAQKQQQADYAGYLERCEYIAQSYVTQLNAQPITGVAALIEWLYISTELLNERPTTQWMEEFQSLLSIPKLDLPTAVALLLEDSEVLSKLRAAKLLDYVKTSIRAMLDPKAHIPIGLEFRFSREAIVRPLFEEISSGIPIQGIQRYIDDIFLLIIQTEEPFDGAWLYEQLERQASEPLAINRRYIDEILTLLNLRGFLNYNAANSTYQVDSDQLLRSLMIPQELTVTPEAHINHIHKRQERQHE